MIRCRSASNLRCWIVAGALSLVATAAWASSGVVINPQGEPLEGVRVCYVAGGSETLCVSSDADGEWSLPRSSIDEIRMTLAGYLPKTVSSGDQAEPVMLEIAAILLVRLVDASGAAVEQGEVELIYSSGRRLGPFPISRAAGTRIRSLQPGPVVIVGRSAGFEEGRAAESELRGGEETVAVVRLEPAG